MDFPAETQSLLAHYVAMASLPNDAGKAQAWHSVNELAANHPQFYGDLPEMLKAAMLERKVAVHG